MNNRIHSLIEWLRRIVTEPRSELTRFQKTVRFTYDLGRYGALQLRRDSAPQMAAALAFRTLFGLLPVMVVGTIVIKAFGGFTQFQARLEEFFRALGLHEYQVTAASESGSASESLSDWLLGLIGQVEHINLAAITWVGVIVLVYSAISLMVTIENSFNNIYRAPEGRSWFRRVPIYFTMLVGLAPASIAASVYMNNVVSNALVDLEGWWSLLSVGADLWTFVLTWLVMIAVYKWLPNTNVAFRPALIGAFVAAVLIELGKRTLGAYMGNAMSIQQLYGSLGLIPVFMFWVYLMWLVVLFGLEVSAILQSLGGRRIEEMEARANQTGLVDPASVLVLMEIIGERFGESSSSTAREIAETASLPEATVSRLIDELVRERLLHRLAGDERAVTLARPPEQIPADQLMQIGWRLVDQGSGQRQSALLRRLREVQLRQASQSTLASLLSS